MKQVKEIVNRKAKFEYHFLQGFDAGIILQGTEVKSLRRGEGNLSDAYCVFRNGELYIRNMFIAEYSHGNVNNHETRRERKLLLRKPELKKLEKRVTEKGLTVVPYKVFFSERGHAKVEIYLAQGKKSYDKRDSIKQKDMKRDLDRMNKL
jgi:SsrA-binding protein